MDANSLWADSIQLIESPMLVESNLYVMDNPPLHMNMIFRVDSVKSISDEYYRVLFDNGQDCITTLELEPNEYGIPRGRWINDNEWLLTEFIPLPVAGIDY